VATYVDEALNDGELRAAPRLLQITYTEDVTLQFNSIKFCDLLCNEQTFAIK
jgi:hypothetical protein